MSNDLDLNSRSNPDILAEDNQEIELHPSPEMLLLREAIAKGLNSKQRKLWDYWAYDKLTQEEIGKKLRISQQAVGQRIATIEKRIAKYCKAHQEAYDTITGVEANDFGC